MTRTAARLLSISISIALLSSCGPAPSGGVPVVAVSGGGTAPGIVEVAPAGTAQAQPPKAAPAIVWERSEIDARHRAQAYRLPLVVFVCADWATAAVKMDRLTWAEPRVMDRARAFVTLRIDLTATDASSQAEADSFDLSMIPSTLILDDKGREIVRLEGFAGPNEVLSAMARIQMPAD